MSTYYKQEFVSPAPLFAEVKESLKSYFASGAIDDVMFPKWLEHCLRKFRKSSFKIEEAALVVKDYEVCLPHDFAGVREAWSCSVEWSMPYQSASAIYWQSDYRLDMIGDCLPDTITSVGDCNTEFLVTNKTNYSELFRFTRSHLLRPGNVNARKHCGEYCKNLYAYDRDSFDIVNGKMVTTFAEGCVYLIYYSNATNDDAEQQVPDNYWVQDYIRKFLMYKCFEQLSNIVTDETFNQIQAKLDRYERQQAEAFILAETELKKQTADEKIRQIKVSYNINNKYKLP